MNAQDKFTEKKVNLHSEAVSVIEREVSKKPFLLAMPNGRCRVWAERFFEIEPEFISFTENLKENDILWDIGCSISHFAIYATLVSGCKTYGFEPEAQNFSISNLNHYLNHEYLKGRYTPLNFGVSTSSSLQTMNIRLFGAGEHTKTLSDIDNKTYSTKVLMMSLEDTLDLGIEKPTVLKIDVDGSEKIVVEAIEPILDTVRLVFIELNKKDIPHFTAIFEKHGFSLKEEHSVVKMSGGLYEDILNLVFVRR